MADCVMPELDRRTNELQDSLKEDMKEYSKGDLLAQIYSKIFDYKEDITDPKLKVEISKLVGDFSGKLAKLDLKNENDKIYNNQHIERTIKEFNEDFEKFIIKEHQDGGQFPGILGSTLKFFNKNFKGLTVGISLGKVFTEGAQAGGVVLTQKLSRMGSALNNKTFLLSTLGFDKNYTMPDAGYINKRDYSKNIIGESTMKTGNAIYDFLSKPANFLMKMQGGIMDPVMGKLENQMYRSLFEEKYIELAIKESRMGADKNSPIDKSNDFLFKDNITSQNQIRKQNIINEAKRLARTEAQKLFFDYKDNPLIVHKMEQFIPFTNFMYSGIRLLSKYPKSMMFAAVALNNIQYAYGSDVWYIDDDGERVDAGVALRMPILASIGLGGVQMNMQRMLQFSPTSIGLNPLPIFSFLTNREDFRWKDFYTKGDMASLQKVALGMMGPTIQQLFEGIDGLDKEVDPKTKENATAKVTQALAYIATGMPIKDKTQQLAWQWYINKDYDKLLTLSDLQLNQFFKHPTNVKNGITRDSIKGAKTAMDLGLLQKDWETDTKSSLLQALSGMTLHESVVEPEDLYHNQKQISNLVEFILGSVKEGDQDKEFIDKCVTFSKSTYFKDFKNYNETMYNTYKHFADNATYYKDQQRTIELMNSDDEDNQKLGTAMNLALKYRFEGDSGMSLDEKAKGIMYGKIYMPIFHEGNEAEGLPAGPLMTEGYFNSLHFKGDKVVNYMMQANTVSALEKSRKTFNRLAGMSTDKTTANKYYKISNNIYEKEVKAYTKFATTATPEFELFLMSKDGISFKDYKQKQDEYLNNKMKNKAKTEASKINKITSMSEDEKKFYNSVFGTNIDTKAKAKVSDMLGDLGNPYYNQEIAHKKTFQNILNQLNHGE